MRTKVLRARHAKLSGFAFSKLPVCSSSLHQSKPPRSVGIEGHHLLDLSVAPSLPSSQMNRPKRRSSKRNTMHLPNQRSKKIASRTLTICTSARCGSRSRRRSQLLRLRLRRINSLRSLPLRKHPRSCPPPQLDRISKTPGTRRHRGSSTAGVAPAPSEKSRDQSLARLSCLRGTLPRTSTARAASSARFAMLISLGQPAHERPADCGFILAVLV